MVEIYIEGPKGLTQKNILGIISEMTSLDPDLAGRFKRPGVDSNYLQKLSADYAKSRFVMTE